MEFNETKTSSNGLGDTEQTQIEDLITWPWIVTMSLCSWVIGSAHYLTKKKYLGEV